jgi:hypothetical protein
MGNFKLAVIQPAAIMLLAVGKPGVAMTKGGLGNAFNQ